MPQIAKFSLNKARTSQSHIPGSRSLLVFAALIVVVGTVAAFNRHKQETGVPTNEALTVQVANPKIQEFKQDVVLTGTITARDPLQIGTELSGLKVKEILVEEGQLVQRGQVLARLDPSVLDANLREEQGQLLNAKASWQKSLQPNRKEAIAVQKAAHQSAIAAISQKKSAIQKAQAEYNNSVSIAERYRQLYDEGGATAQDVQQKNTDVQSYLAALETARENLQQARFSAVQEQERLQELSSGGRPEDISAAHGTVMQHEAKISNLKAQLEQTYIKSLDSGIVSERLVHLGDISSSGQVMFKLIRRGELELQARVSVDDLAKVSVGQLVSIPNEDGAIEGVVWMVSPVVDPVSRLGKVRIALKNPGNLKNGMFVTAIFSLSSPKGTVVPETALLTVDGNNYVFVETNGLVKKTLVSIGSRSDHMVLIKKGLSGSERVVQQGVAFLSDNDEVRVR